MFDILEKWADMLLMDKKSSVLIRAIKLSSKRVKKFHKTDAIGKYSRAHTHTTQNEPKLDECRYAIMNSVEWLIEITNARVN